MQLLIIDGLNLIRRLYSVHTHQAADDLQALAATGQSLVNACQRLLRQFNPSHVVAVFDGAPKGFRYHLYPEYKAGRAPMPQALAEHLPQLQQQLWQLGIDALLPECDEADDIIATLATTLGQHQKHSVIVSTDQGFCQLLNPYTKVWDHFKQRALDQAFVEQHYQVHVSQLIDYWALTGVAGSNIKGVAGIGPKRAQRLIQQHTSLDQLLTTVPTSPDEQRVIDHKAEALLARQLVKMAHDIELGVNLQDLRYIPATKGS